MYRSISLNEDFDELIMVRKLKKVIKDFRRWDYFRRIGTERVSEDDIKDRQVSEAFEKVWMNLR